jgi:hypothetical protein
MMSQAQIMTTGWPRFIILLYACSCTYDVVTRIREQTLAGGSNLDTVRNEARNLAIACVCNADYIRALLAQLTEKLQCFLVARH